MKENSPTSAAPVMLALAAIAGLAVAAVALNDNKKPAPRAAARGAPIRGAPIVAKKAAPALPPKPKPAAEAAASEVKSSEPAPAKVEAAPPAPAVRDQAPAEPAPAPAEPAEPKKETIKAPKPVAEVYRRPRGIPKAVPESEKKAEAKPADGLELIDFEELAGYTYKTPWGKVTKEMLKKQIPDDILAHNGKRIRVTGYMLPMDIADNGDVKAFFLMKDLASCCFGGTPRMNEWILVKVNEGVKVRYIAYQAIDVDGPIEVGEKIENGRLSSLYRMKATAVTPKT